MKQHADAIIRFGPLLICILLAVTGCAPAPTLTIPAAPTIAALPTLAVVATPTLATSTTVPTVPPSATPTRTPAASLPTPIASARLNEPFTLQMSQSAILPDANNPRITFTNVLEDSRCPSDANCMQVGRARVAITVESGGRLARFDLSTNGTDLNAVGAFEGILFELAQVMPLPAHMGTPTPPGDFRVTLRALPGSLDQSTARFNEPFTLKIGQSVGFEGSTMRLTFQAVQQDSRCPTRVLCATSGMAVLTILASHDGASETDAVQVGGNEVMTSFPAVRTVSVRIRANALTPYPQQEFASKEIAPNEYQATFVVINPATPLVAPTPR